MKNAFPLFAGISMMLIALSSCQQIKPMDEATIMMKADSIAQSKMAGIADSLSIDCQAKSEAWIKMKADSIYEAALANQK